MTNCGRHFHSFDHFKINFFTRTYYLINKLIRDFYWGKSTGTFVLSPARIVAIFRVPRESRIFNSVKVFRFQLSSILDALEEVSETTNNLIARSVDVSLLNEIGNYEFILSLVIWYILTEVNNVSKSVQDHNEDISISVNMNQVILQYLHQYRENGINLAKITVNKLAEDADIAVAFKNLRVRKKY